MMTITDAMEASWTARQDAAEMARYEQGAAFAEAWDNEYPDWEDQSRDPENRVLIEGVLD